MADEEKLTVTCEACGGDRGWDVPGAWMWVTRWVPCRACDGKGEVEVETLPVECDDDLERLEERYGR